VRKGTVRFCAAMLCLALLWVLLPSLSLTARAEYTWIYDKTYTANGKSVPLASLPLDMHYENCWEFAQEAYQEIWGQPFSEFLDSEEDMLRGMDSDDRYLNEANLRAFVAAAEIGAVMRLCRADNLYGGDLEGHNQIILQKDDRGFTVYEGNIGWNEVITIAYYTYDTYLKLWPQYDYIKYVKWPGAPEFRKAYVENNTLWQAAYAAQGTALPGSEAYTLPWVDGTALETQGITIPEGTELPLYRMLEDTQGRLWLETENASGEMRYVRREHIRIEGLEGCGVTELRAEGTLLQQTDLYAFPGGEETCGTAMLGQKTEVLHLAEAGDGIWLEVLAGDQVGYLPAEETVLISCVRQFRTEDTVLLKAAPSRRAGWLEILWPGDILYVHGMLYDAGGRIWLELQGGGYVPLDKVTEMAIPPLRGETD